MPRRALAVAASIGLLLGVAMPAAARNINARQPLRPASCSRTSGSPPDTDLVNGWGIVASSTSPWWVSDNGTSKSTLYNGNTGAKLGLVVSVPGPPTGVVFNGSSDFKVDAGTGLAAVALHLRDRRRRRSRAGTASGRTRSARCRRPTTIYLGLAIANNGGANHLYVANFNQRQVDVFDGTFTEVDLSGDFTDPACRRLRPVQRQSDRPGRSTSPTPKQDASGRGGGPRRGAWASSTSTTSTATSWLASPRSATSTRRGAWRWRRRCRQRRFGKFSGDLLVGNFGDGRIHAFRAQRGRLGGGTASSRAPTTGRSRSTGCGASASATAPAPVRRTRSSSRPGPTTRRHGLFGSITPPAQ